jgi:hypothetical protein
MSLEKILTEIGITDWDVHSDGILSVAATREQLKGLVTDEQLSKLGVGEEKEITLCMILTNDKDFQIGYGDDSEDCEDQDEPSEPYTNVDVTPTGVWEKVRKGLELYGHED